LEEVGVCVGQQVLMAVDKILLIFGDSQGKLDHQLRLHPIHLFSIILIDTVERLKQTTFTKFTTFSF
jgi:hypothetical protein